MKARFHIVVVEGYEGLVECYEHEPDVRAAGRGIGLPLDELARALDARVTVLDWDPWLELEQRGRLFTGWMGFPATRPVTPLPPAPPLEVAPGGRVVTRSIAATDPGDGRDLAARKPSLRGFGLLADNDPLVYLGYRLAGELREMQRETEIDLLIAPALGGLACLTQLERATGVDGAFGAPVAVVATDTSAARQRVDQEGVWSREAVSRRQMEELSLALADAVVAFGPRGEALARRGRLPDAPPPLRLPRRIPPEALALLEERSSRRPGAAPPASLLFEGPLAPASGALVALDAAQRLARRAGVGRGPATACVGPDMRFAPMAPRTFREYWGSRGFVKELESAGRWTWAGERPGDAEARLRLHVAPWAHLPAAWLALARGSPALLSPAAAEGLVEPAAIPPRLALQGEPTAANVAAAAARLLEDGPEALEADRAELCRAICSERGELAESRLGEAAQRLRTLMEGVGCPQRLDRVTRMLLDRRVPPSEVEARLPEPAPLEPVPGEVEGALSVVIPCHGMGSMLREAVESVWASDRVPEEVIVVDDGSTDVPTRNVIAGLEAEAARRGHPLSVLRQGNGGLAAARNAGLAVARGEFVVFLDGDDLIEPAFFRLARSLLERHPRLGGVAAWSLIFDERGVVGHWNAPQPEFPLQLVENCVFVPLMMRTRLLNRIGPVDERQRYNYEDWELSCRILAEGWPIVTIPAYLQRYRERGDSLYRTMTPVQNQVMREAMLERHRRAVEPFAVELAMMVENRLQRRSHEPARAGRGRAARRWIRLGRQAAHVALERLSAGFRSRGRSPRPHRSAG